MNKAILAACAGVTFGLFLGGLLMSGGVSLPTCHRQKTVVTQAQTYSVASQSQMTRHVVIEQRIIRSSDGVIHSETTRTETHMGAAMDSDETLTQAQTAYVNGDYAQAITLAKMAAKDSPIRASRIIGSAACQTKNLALVEESYRKLDAPSRQYLVYVCQRNGISARGNRFVLTSDR